MRGSGADTKKKDLQTDSESDRHYNTMAEEGFKSFSEISLTEKHLPYKMDSLQDCAKVFKGVSFKEEYQQLPGFTHSSSLQTTLSPKRSKDKRRVTFLEDYANVQVSGRGLSVDSQVEEEDVCSKKPAISTTPFPEDPDPGLKIWAKNQNLKMCPSTANIAPRKINDLTQFQTEMEASINKLLQLTTDLEIATSFPNRVPNRSTTDYHSCGAQLSNVFPPSLSEDRPLEVDGYNSALKQEQSSEDKPIKLIGPPASVSPAGMMITEQPISSIDRNRQIASSQMMTHSTEKPTEVSKVNLISLLKFRGN